ncbi:hypothetical protein V5799_021727 [Amblyomma americanum]|uniref:Uncharacterized protein n=1 Tax=Amblyomma americanum TaxID=6943 RepID=A0AAQ4FMN0_AMBAM
MPLLPRVEDYASGVPQPDLVAKPPLTEGGQEKEPFRETIRGEGFQPYVPGREQELHEDLLLPEVYEDQSAHAAWTPMEVSAIETGPLVSEAPFEFAPKKEEPIVELALPEVQEKEALYEPEVEKKLPTLEAEPEGAEMAFPLEVERVKEMSSVEELILPEVQEQETLGAEERKEEASTVAMTPVYAETQVLLPPWKEKEPELQARELQAEEALKASSVVLPSAYAPPPMPLLPRVEDYASGVPQPDLVAKPPLTEGGQEKEPFREIIRGEGFQPYVPGREQELHEDLLLPEVYEDQSAHAAWTPMEVSAIETAPEVSEEALKFALKKEEPSVELALPEVQEKEALYESEVEKKLPAFETEPESAEVAFPLAVEKVQEMSSFEELILPEVQEQEALAAEETIEEESTLTMVPVITEAPVLLPPWKEIVTPGDVAPAIDLVARKGKEEPPALLVEVEAEVKVKETDIRMDVAKTSIEQASWKGTEAQPAQEPELLEVQEEEALPHTLVEKEIVAVEMKPEIAELAIEFVPRKDEGSVLTEQRFLPEVQETGGIPEEQAENKVPGIRMAAEFEGMVADLKYLKVEKEKPVELVLPEVQEEDAEPEGRPQEQISAFEFAPEVSEPKTALSPTAEKEQLSAELILPEVQEQEPLPQAETEKKFPAVISQETAYTCPGTAVSIEGGADESVPVELQPPFLAAVTPPVTKVEMVAGILPEIRDEKQLPADSYQQIAPPDERSVHPKETFPGWSREPPSAEGEQHDITKPVEVTTRRKKKLYHAAFIMETEDIMETASAIIEEDGRPVMSAFDLSVSYQKEVVEDTALLDAAEDMVTSKPLGADQESVVTHDIQSAAYRQTVSAKGEETPKTPVPSGEIPGQQRPPVKESHERMEPSVEERLYEPICRQKDEKEISSASKAEARSNIEPWMLILPTENAPREPEALEEFQKIYEGEKGSLFSIVPPQEQTASDTESMEEAFLFEPLPEKETEDSAPKELADKLADEIRAQHPGYDQEYQHGISDTEVWQKKIEQPPAEVPTGRQEQSIAQHPGYALEYMHVPEFLTKEPAARKQAEGILEQPPGHQVEYLYVPDFMTREPEAAEVTSEETKGLFVAVAAEEIPVEPPAYELEYLHVPDFMTRELETVEVPWERTEGPLSFVVARKAAKSTPVEPLGYELEYLHIPDFMTTEPEAPERPQRKKEGPSSGIPSAQPAENIHVEPPDYEMEYLYAPELLSKELPSTVVPWTEEAPPEVLSRQLTEQALIRPSDYETEFRYVPDSTAKETEAKAPWQEPLSELPLGKAERIPVQPPGYELEYLYVPEFMTKEPAATELLWKENGGPLAETPSAKPAANGYTQPPGYQQEYQNIPDFMTREAAPPKLPCKEEWSPTDAPALQITKESPTEEIQVDRPDYELQYLHVPEFMTREPATPELLWKEGQIVGVSSAEPEQKIPIQPPDYEMEYLYVPEFMTKEPAVVEVPCKELGAPADVRKEKIPADISARRPGYEIGFQYVPELIKHQAPPGEVRDRKLAESFYVQPPGYELEYLYVPEFMMREPAAPELQWKEERAVFGVPTAKLEKEIQVQPPDYEMEYLHVPEFMTREPAAPELLWKEEQTVGVPTPKLEHEITVQPPDYDLEYLHVPEFMTRARAAPELLWKEEKTVGAPSAEQEQKIPIQPPDYEMEYLHVPEFMTREPAAPELLWKEGQIVGVPSAEPEQKIQIQPPEYELEYLHVPEFMTKEPAVVEVPCKELGAPAEVRKEKIPADISARPPGYEIGFQYVPEFIKHQAPTGEVRDRKLAEPFYVQPPDYEMEYLHVPEFMTREPAAPELLWKEGQTVGVPTPKLEQEITVQPPAYELEYLHVPEFMTRATAAPELLWKEGQTVGAPSAELEQKIPIQPPEYEMEYLHVPEFMTRGPAAPELLWKEGQIVGVPSAEPEQKIQIQPPEYELEYLHVPEFMTKEPAVVEVPCKELGAPAEVRKEKIPADISARPPGYEIGFQYVPEFIKHQAPTGEVRDQKLAEPFYEQAPGCELEYLYVPEFMTTEPAAPELPWKEEGTVFGVFTAKLEQGIQVQPPDYEMEYLHVPEFMTREPAAPELLWKEGKTVGVPSAELEQKIPIQPPHYEMEYLHVPEFMTREPAASELLWKEGKIVGVPSADPEQKIRIQPPEYELEYLYVPEFMTKEPAVVEVPCKELGAPAEVRKEKIPADISARPPGYEIGFQYVPEYIKHQPPTGEVRDQKLAEPFYVQPPGYELEYMYVPEFMTREPAAPELPWKEEGTVFGVPTAKLEQGIQVQPPDYEMEYLHVPEFMTREPAAPELLWKEGQTVGVPTPKLEQEIKVQPPDYELEYLHVPEFMTREPAAPELLWKEGQTVGVPTPKLEQEITVQPPDYELEYLHVPEFMTREPTAPELLWKEGQTVGVPTPKLEQEITVQPPEYELEYLHVPEFMTREQAAPELLWKEEQIVGVPSAEPEQKIQIQPAEYELEYLHVPEFMTREPAAPELLWKEGQTVGVPTPKLEQEIAVQPPDYELEYLHVPEFMTREPKAPELLWKEGQTVGVPTPKLEQEITVQPPDYELEYLHVPEFMTREPKAPELLWKEGQTVGVPTPKLEQEIKVQPPDYELEYLHVPEFMTREPAAPELLWKEGQTVGVPTPKLEQEITVQPPDYELEYLHVPEFMTREPTAPELLWKEGQTVGVPTPKLEQEITVQPPEYELEYLHVPEFMTREPAAPELLSKEGQIVGVPSAEPQQNIQIQPAEYELEYLHVPEFMTREPAAPELLWKEGQTVGVPTPKLEQEIKVQPPDYELEYLHVPEFMKREPAAPELLWKEGQTVGVPTPKLEQEITVQPPDYELEYLNVPEFMTREPAAPELLWKEGQTVGVPTPKLEQEITVQPPDYELEYLNVPEFMTREPAAPELLWKEGQTVGVPTPKLEQEITVQPPDYELEYLHVPEFMTREPTAPELLWKEGQTVGVPTPKLEQEITVQPPEYEFEYLHVPEFMTREPAAPELLWKEGQTVGVPTPKLEQEITVQPPEYELEYLHVPEFMTREPAAPELLWKEEQIVGVPSAEPEQKIQIQPPAYELEYLYVPEFMTKEPAVVEVPCKELGAPAEVRKEKIPADISARPPGYEIGFQYVPEFIKHQPPTGEVCDRKLAEPFYVQPPGYELEYMYVPEFMTREPAAPELPWKEEGTVFGVPTAKLEQGVQVQPPDYDMEYRHEPEFMSREPAAPELLWKEGQIVVPSAELEEKIPIQPPDYDMEYLYVPEFMTKEPAVVEVPCKELGAPAEVRKEKIPADISARPPGYEIGFQYVPKFIKHQAPTGEVRDQKLAEPFYVQPPCYELEYLYVPEFMTREPAAPELPWKEEGAVFGVPTAKLEQEIQVQPPDYEMEYLHVPEFMTKEPAAHELLWKEGKIVGVPSAEPEQKIQIQPPEYESEYLHVPEFMTKEPAVVEVPCEELGAPAEVRKEKIPADISARSPGYEIEFQYVPEFIKHQAPAGEVRDRKLAEPFYVQPPGYELEYLYIPEFMTREPAAPELPWKEEGAVFGVPTAKLEQEIQVQPPDYEMEYLHVPEFMSREPAAPGLLWKEEQIVGIPSVELEQKIQIQPPDYELEYLFVPEFMTREPTGAEVPCAEIRAPDKISKEKFPDEFPAHPPGYEIHFHYASESVMHQAPPGEVSDRKLSEPVCVQPPGYELEYMYVPEFMNEEPLKIEVVQREKTGPLSDAVTAKPAEEMQIEPPVYQLEYLYVPDFMTKEPADMEIKAQREVEAAVVTATPVSSDLVLGSGVVERTELRLPEGELFSLSDSEPGTEYPSWEDLTREKKSVEAVSPRPDSGEIVSEVEDTALVQERLPSSKEPRRRQDLVDAKEVFPEPLSGRPFQDEAVWEQALPAEILGEARKEPTLATPVFAAHEPEIFSETPGSIQEEKGENDEVVMSAEESITREAAPVFSDSTPVKALVPDTEAGVFVSDVELEATRQPPAEVPTADKKLFGEEVGFSLQVTELRQERPASRTLLASSPGGLLLPKRELTTEIQGLSTVESATARYGPPTELTKRSSVEESSGAESTSYKEAVSAEQAYPTAALVRQVFSSDEMTTAFESAESTLRETPKPKSAAVAACVPGEPSTSSPEASRLDEKEKVTPAADDQTREQIARSISGLRLPITHDVRTEVSRTLEEDVAKGLFHYSRRADIFGTTEVLEDADLDKIKQEFDCLAFPPENEVGGVKRNENGRHSSSSSDFSSFSAPADAITRRMVRDVTTTERFQKLVTSRSQNKTDEDTPAQALPLKQQTACHRDSPEILTTEKVTRMKEKLEFIEPITAKGSSSSGNLAEKLEERSTSAEFITKSIVLKSEKEEEMQYVESMSAACSKDEPDGATAGAEESKPTGEEERFVTTNVKKETRVKETFQIVKPKILVKRRRSAEHKAHPTKKVRRVMCNEVTVKQFLQTAEGRKRQVVEAEMVASLRPAPEVHEEEAGKPVPMTVEERPPLKRTKRLRSPCSAPPERDFEVDLPSVDELELGLHPPMGIRSPLPRIDADTVIQAADMEDIPSAEEGEVTTTLYSFGAKSLPTHHSKVVEMSVLSGSDAPSVEEADFPISPVTGQTPLSSRPDFGLGRQSSLKHRLSLRAAAGARKSAPEIADTPLSLKSPDFLSPPVDSGSQVNRSDSSLPPSLPPHEVQMKELREHEWHGSMQQPLATAEQEKVVSQLESKTIGGESVAVVEKPTGRPTYKEITATEESQPPEPYVPEAPLVTRPSSPTYRLLGDAAAQETVSPEPQLEPLPEHYPQIKSPEARSTYKIIDTTVVEEPAQQYEEIPLVYSPPSHEGSRFRTYVRQDSEPQPLTANEEELVEAKPPSKAVTQPADESLPIESAEGDTAVPVDNQPSETRIDDAALISRPSSPTYRIIEAAATPEVAEPEPAPPLPVVPVEVHPSYKIIDATVAEEPEEQLENMVTSGQNSLKKRFMPPELTSVSSDTKLKGFRILGQPEEVSSMSVSEQQPIDARQKVPLQYEQEYLYIPDFMKQAAAGEASGEISDTGGERVLEYTLEYIYVPEFMKTDMLTEESLGQSSKLENEETEPARTLTGADDSVQYKQDIPYAPDVSSSDVPAEKVVPDVAAPQDTSLETKEPLLGDHTLAAYRAPSEQIESIESTAYESKQELVTHVESTKARHPIDVVVQENYESHQEYTLEFGVSSPEPLVTASSEDFQTYHRTSIPKESADSYKEHRFPDDKLGTEDEKSKGHGYIGQEWKDHAKSGHEKTEGDLRAVPSEEVQKYSASATDGESSAKVQRTEHEQPEEYQDNYRSEASLTNAKAPDKVLRPSDELPYEKRVQESFAEILPQDGRLASEEPVQYTIDENLAPVSKVPSEQRDQAPKDETWLDAVKSAQGLSPVYDLEYLHVPDFMKMTAPAEESTGSVVAMPYANEGAATADQTQAVPATVICKKPRGSESEYSYEPSSIQKETSAEETYMPATELPCDRPPGYEQEYLYVPDFMELSSTVGAPCEEKESSFKGEPAANPTNYVQAPEYELEYLYVPDFMKIEASVQPAPPSVHLDSTARDRQYMHIPLSERNTNEEVAVEAPVVEYEHLQAADSRRADALIEEPQGEERGRQQPRDHELENENLKSLHLRDAFATESSFSFPDLSYGPESSIDYRPAFKTPAKEQPDEASDTAAISAGTQAGMSETEKPPGGELPEATYTEDFATAAHSLATLASEYQPAVGSLKMPGDSLGTSAESEYTAPVDSETTTVRDNEMTEVKREEGFPPTQDMEHGSVKALTEHRDDSEPQQKSSEALSSSTEADAHLEKKPDFEVTKKQLVEGSSEVSSDEIFSSAVTDFKHVRGATEEPGLQPHEGVKSGMISFEQPLAAETTEVTSEDVFLSATKENERATEASLQYEVIADPSASTRHVSIPTSESVYQTSGKLQPAPESRLPAAESMDVTSEEESGPGEKGEHGRVSGASMIYHGVTEPSVETEEFSLPSSEQACQSDDVRLHETEDVTKRTPSESTEVTSQEGLATTIKGYGLSAEACLQSELSRKHEQDSSLPVEPAYQLSMKTEPESDTKAIASAGEHAEPTNEAFTGFTSTEEHDRGPQSLPRYEALAEHSVESNESSIMSSEPAYQPRELIPETEAITKSSAEETTEITSEEMLLPKSKQAYDSVIQIRPQFETLTEPLADTIEPSILPSEPAYQMAGSAGAEPEVTTKQSTEEPIEKTSEENISPIARDEHDRTDSLLDQPPAEPSAETQEFSLPTAEETHKHSGKELPEVETTEPQPSGSSEPSTTQTSVVTSTEDRSRTTDSHMEPQSFDAPFLPASKSTYQFLEKVEAEPEAIRAAMQSAPHSSHQPPTETRVEWEAFKNAPFAEPTEAPSQDSLFSITGADGEALVRKPEGKVESQVFTAGSVYEPLVATEQSLEDINEENRVEATDTTSDVLSQSPMEEYAVDDTETRVAKTSQKTGKATLLSTKLTPLPLAQTQKQLKAVTEVPAEKQAEATFEEVSQPTTSGLLQEGTADSKLAAAGVQQETTQESAAPVKLPAEVPTEEAHERDDAKSRASYDAHIEPERRDSELDSLPYINFSESQLASVEAPKAEPERRESELDALPYINFSKSQFAGAPSAEDEITIEQSELRTFQHAPKIEATYRSVVTPVFAPSVEQPVSSPELTSQSPVPYEVGPVTVAVQEGVEYTSLTGADDRVDLFAQYGDIDFLTPMATIEEELYMLISDLPQENVVPAPPMEFGPCAIAEARPPESPKQPSDSAEMPRVDLSLVEVFPGPSTAPVEISQIVVPSRVESTMGEEPDRSRQEKETER